QHQPALGDDLGDVAVAAEQAADGFPQVDDVDQVALAVDVRPHLRVPPAGPVAEVNSGLDEVLYLNDRHAPPSCPQAGKLGPRVEKLPAPRRIRRRPKKWREACMVARATLPVKRF